MPKIKKFSVWFKAQFGLKRPKLSIEVAYENFKKAEHDLWEVRHYEQTYEAAKKGWYGKP